MTIEQVINFHVNSARISLAISQAVTPSSVSSSK
jgi:hypothetical protein